MLKTLNQMDSDTKMDFRHDDKCPHCKRKMPKDKPKTTPKKRGRPCKPKVTPPPKQPRAKKEPRVLTPEELEVRHKKRLATNLRYYEKNREKLLAKYKAKNALKKKYSKPGRPRIYPRENNESV
jgi:hypothetical protein